MKKCIIIPVAFFVVIVTVASCSKDNEEDQPGNNGCVTENMSFANNIQPILNANCTTCHNPNLLNGNVNLTTYDGVKVVADNGKLVGVINHSPGFPPMPQSGGKLSDCNIDKIEAWISQGKQNN